MHVVIESLIPIAHLRKPDQLTGLSEKTGDELVGTITTDGTGVAQLDNLPLGKYYIVEKETSYGYVLDDEPRYVDLTYRDQDTPVVTQNVMIWMKTL